MIKLKEKTDFYEHSILPLGSLNLKTGQCQIFNVYDTWNDATCEVWMSLLDGNYKLIFTTGNKPYAKIGTKWSFKHDQNMKFLFNAEMIDYAHISNLIILLKYGKIIPAYVYK
jgi:hypothetical protein